MKIRLVNPYRGYIFYTRYKHFDIRTANCLNFSIYAVHQGIEFYPGRQFERQELYSWLAGEPIPPDSQKLSDFIGNIPATAPNPKMWVWRGFHGGERKLAQDLKPEFADLQVLAGKGLIINPTEFHQVGDPWELWICDKNQNPLFLAMTGLSLEDISYATYSPMFIGEVGEAKIKINKLANLSEEEGKFRWVERLFRRNLDGSSLEYRGNPPKFFGKHPPGFLPEGYLAEPFQTEINNPT